jgi:ATP-dependent DNA ligase
MLPRVLNPMLARKADAPFDSDEYMFELKWDGIRCLAFIEHGRLRLQSRQLTDVTIQFPELACLKELPCGTVLDGELVALENGKPSLRIAQQRVLTQSRHRIGWLSRTHRVIYMVFDLPYLDGKPLFAEPLSLRRAELHQLIERFSLPGVLVPEGVRTHGQELFAQVVRLGLEGIMAKRLDGPYLPGKRSSHWLKIKPIPALELPGVREIRTTIPTNYENGIGRNGGNPPQQTGRKLTARLPRRT